MIVARSSYCDAHPSSVRARWEAGTILRGIARATRCNLDLEVHTGDALGHLNHLAH